MLSGAKSIDIKYVKRALKGNFEAEKLFDWIRETKEYNEKALEEIFSEKKYLRNVMEKAHQEQVTRNQYRPLRKQLENYEQILEETRSVIFPDPVDFLGLMNEILNVVEESTGSQIGETMFHRENMKKNFSDKGISGAIKNTGELTEDQKEAIKKELSETISFCGKRERTSSFFSNTDSLPKMDEKVWGEIIWNAKRIDELIISVSQEEVISALKGQVPSISEEQTKKILNDLFGTTSHLGHLMNDYEDARRKEEAFPLLSPLPAPLVRSKKGESFNFAAAAAMPAKSEKAPPISLPKRKSPVANVAKQPPLVIVKQRVTPKIPTYSDKRPDLPPAAKEEEAIPLANPFEILAPQETISSVKDNVSEPSTSTLHVQAKSTKSKKKKAREPIEDEDTLLKKAIREAAAERSKLPQTGSGKTAADISRLIKKGHDFIDDNILTDENEFKSLDNLDGNEELVLLYLDAVELKEGILEVRKMDRGNPILDDHTRKDFNTFANLIPHFVRECEEKIRAFFKAPFAGRRKKESLIIMASYMCKLYEAKKLDDFLPFDVKLYCQNLFFKQFESVEKDYLFQYKCPAPLQGDTVEQFIQHVWMQSKLCVALQDIEKLFAKEEEMTPQEAKMAAISLQLIAETCLIEEKNQPLFFNNLTRDPSSQALHSHYEWMWRCCISLYSIPMANLLLPKVDSNACDAGLFFACADNAILDPPMSSARLEFINLLLADKRTNANIKQKDIKTFEKELQGGNPDYTPLTLACGQADSETVKSLLYDSDADPNLLIEDQPPLWYLFVEDCEEQYFEPLKKVMQLLMHHPRTIISPDLLSHIEASPHIRLKEAFMQEYNLRAQTDRKEERRSNPIATLNQMLEGVDFRSTEEREERVRAFSSPPLTFAYSSDSEEKRKHASVVQETKKEKIKLSSRSV